ncbi:MAG: type III glutamate--ammonia ligase [Sphingomonadales bacterium]|nr:type III glutamate--ammonia ligase [Sphingomonadales bacterium]
MSQPLSAIAKDTGIQYFLVSFTDLFGVQRSKLVPAQAIDAMAESGAGFAGFAAWLDLGPADADMFAVPDTQQLIQLPWKPEVGWLPADPVINGAPLAHAPRNVLKAQMARAAEAGYVLKTGVECEFMLLSPEGDALSDPHDGQSKPCYDQQALLRRYDVIAEICDAMLTLGWEPYQNDHEDANGQFEMNWGYADALITADRHAFFKFMVKAIAEKHGMRATFMPKLFAELTGNGCHMHASLWDEDGNNAFHDNTGELGLSQTAYHFIAGLLDNAKALTALTNPTVNSYKRINAPTTLSGATWSPNTISYTGNNRTHMIRIPDDDRIELRLADGSTNPYLLAAGVLAAGLDGMERKADPGQRLDIDMYEAGNDPAYADRKLPLNLIDALRELEGSHALRSGLGTDFVSAYVKLRIAEWQDYSRHLTQWERDTTLDC